MNMSTYQETSDFIGPWLKINNIILCFYVCSLYPTYVSCCLMVECFKSMFYTTQVSKDFHEMMLKACIITTVLFSN